MSKRRFKKMEESKKEEERKEAEKPKEAKEARKPQLLLTIVLAVIFFVIGFISASIAGFGGLSVKSNDQLIFISPPGCTSCAQMEPIAMEIAKTLNIPFVKTGFGQQVTNPGFILIYKNISTIAGVGDEYTFKTQICLITNNTEICNQAKKLTPTTEEEEVTPTNVPKSDRPEAHVFIMSHCPYGVQFLKAYVQVMELLGNKADLSVNFVPYIMHGEEEMIHNTHMYCIQKEQKEKFTSYIRCFVESGDSDGCIAKVGVDKAKLDACINATDQQYQLTKTFSESKERFPPYPIDSELANVYGARGSPTFGINGKQVSVSRSAEAIKQAICNAFNNPPPECNQKLSSTNEAPGFGKIGAGSGSTSGSQCG